MNRLRAYAEALGEHRNGDIVGNQVGAKLHDEDRLTILVSSVQPKRFTALAHAESPIWSLRHSVENRIKELRERKGLTLQQVADQAGTSLQQIYRLENGMRRLTVDWMRRIAPVLGVHPAALLLDFKQPQQATEQEIAEIMLVEMWRMGDLAAQRDIVEYVRQRISDAIVPNHTKKRKA